MALVNPLAKLDLQGSLLIVTLLGLMGLLVAFWLDYVNLLQTLWIVVLTSPLSLFLIYSGLRSSKVKAL
jgi:hypothetical protein